MNTAELEQLRQVVTEASAALTTVALFLSDIQARLDVIESVDASSQNGQVSPPYVDRAMFCIHWQDRICFLGDSLTFRLFDCLARRPDRFVPHQHLLSDAWEGSVVDVRTIRSGVRHLKDKLRLANMEGLAAAIVAGRKAYVLRLRPVA